MGTLIHYKTAREIKIMQEGGKRLRSVVEELLEEIKPGVSTKEIDEKSEQLMKKNGGEASFKRVPGYSWATCLPVNEQIVHTPPSERILMRGDLLTLDIGLFYKGFHTDYAISMLVGASETGETHDFLETGRKALREAIAEISTGAYLGQVSRRIETTVQGAGYSIVRELTGHGIGRSLHEDPFILQYLDRPVEETLLIREGLIIAVEVIYTKGKGDITYEKDGWSIRTADRSLSACFEHTVAVMKDHVQVIT